MVRFANLAMFVFLTFVPTQTQAAIPDDKIRIVMNNFVDKFLLPGYQEFVASNKNLQGTLKKLCLMPSGKQLEHARNRFKHTARTWAAIELARIGPMNRENRYERILFYPDRKSTGLRQTIKILKTKDQRALTQEKLTKKSVATQGLGALEYVLFGKGSEKLSAPSSEFRCNYGLSISGNLVNIAEDVRTQWLEPNGIAKTWKNPGTENKEFRNGREALNAIIGLLINNLQVVHDIRLGYFLKEMAEDDRPKRAIYRRSAQTMSIIHANLISLRKLFETTNIASLLPEGQKSIAESVLFEFRQIISVTGDLDAPVEQLLQDKKSRQKLKYLKLTLANLIARLDGELAPAAGLASGFSFSDGD